MDRAINRRERFTVQTLCGVLHLQSGCATVLYQQDAAKWRKEHECATCHHGTMTVWALSEAKRQGYAVGAETLADNLQWTKDQFMPSIRKPRDPRPGWNLVSVPAIYLGVMSQSLPILSRDEINDVAVHLARHQEADRAWPRSRDDQESPGADHLLRHAWATLGLVRRVPHAAESR